MVKRLIMLLAACGGSSATPDAGVSFDAPAGKLMVTGQAVILTGDCRPYVVTGAPAQIDLEGLGQGNAFGDAADCAGGVNPITTLTSSTFYFRDDTAEAVSITATVPGATGMLAIQTVALGALGQADASSDAHLAATIDPLALAIGGGKLVIGDSTAPRVLIWSSVPTANAPPDLVLGQPDLQTAAPRTASAHVSSTVSAVWTDGTRLLVAEPINNRVLGWRTFPTTADQAADFVLGQPDATTTTSLAITASALSGPSGIASDGTRLFVADSGNNRVLVWSTFPTTTGAAASFALGQPDLVTGDSGVSATQLSEPLGLVYAGATLYVSDAENYRVVGFTSIAATAAAAFALGQPDLASGDPSGVTASTLGRVQQLASDGTRLYVADQQNERVLVWSALPSTNAAPASFAIGQPDLVSSTTTNLYQPPAVATDGTRVLVADRDARVLVYATRPTASGATADYALGQPNLTQLGGDAIAPSAATLYLPSGAFTDGERVLVADTAHNRVLAWRSIPRTSSQPADFVLGQPDFATTAVAAPSATSLSAPSSITSDGTHLFVADTGNNRVLIWNSIPISSIAADAVLGQADLASGAPGTLAQPARIVAHGGKLYVADANRVQIWNAIPTTNTPADFALGATGAPLGPSAFGSPSGIAFAGAGLAISDASNRVLIWQTAPTASVAADVVLGQTDFTSTTAGTSATTFDGPRGIASDGTRLFVADGGNNRILVWDSLPTTDGAAANHALGQPDLISSLPNRGARLSASSVSGPSDLFWFANHLFVGDSGNARIVSF